MKRTCDTCGRKFRYPGLSYDAQEPALVSHDFWGHTALLMGRLPSTESDVREWVSVHNEMVRARDSFWGAKMQILASTDPTLMKRMGLDPEEYCNEEEVRRGCMYAFLVQKGADDCRAALATETDAEKRAAIQGALGFYADLEPLACTAREDNPFRIDEQRQAAVKLSRAFPDKVSDGEVKLPPAPPSTSHPQAEIATDVDAAGLGGPFIGAGSDGTTRDVDDVGVVEGGGASDANGDWVPLNMDFGGETGDALLLAARFLEAHHVQDFDEMLHLSKGSEASLMAGLLMCADAVVPTFLELAGQDRYLEALDTLAPGRDGQRDQIRGLAVQALNARGGLDAPNRWRDDESTISLSPEMVRELNFDMSGLLGALVNLTAALSGQDSETAFQALIGLVRSTAQPSRNTRSA